MTKKTVSVRPKYNYWEVRVDGSKRAVARVGSKIDAITIAHNRAKKLRAFLLIQ